LKNRKISDLFWKRLKQNCTGYFKLKFTSQ
jgi:hypothetical protein